MLHEVRCLECVAFEASVLFTSSSISKPGKLHWFECIAFEVLAFHMKVYLIPRSLHTRFLDISRFIVCNLTVSTTKVSNVTGVRWAESVNM